MSEATLSQLASKRSILDFFVNKKSEATPSLPSHPIVSNAWHSEIVLGKSKIIRFFFLSLTIFWTKVVRLVSVKASNLSPPHNPAL